MPHAIVQSYQCVCHGQSPASFTCFEYGSTNNVCNFRRIHKGADMLNSQQNKSDAAQIDIKIHPRTRTRTHTHTHTHTHSLTHQNKRTNTQTHTCIHTHTLSHTHTHTHTHTRTHTHTHTHKHTHTHAQRLVFQPPMPVHPAINRILCVVIKSKSNTHIPQNNRTKSRTAPYSPILFPKIYFQRSMHMY